MSDKLKRAEQARKARATGAIAGEARAQVVRDAATREQIEASSKAAARVEADRAAMQAADSRAKTEGALREQAEARRAAEARAAEHARDRGALPSPARRLWPVRAIASFTAALVLGTGPGWFLSSSLLPKGGPEAAGGEPLRLKLDRNLDSFASRLRPPAIKK